MAWDTERTKRLLLDAATTEFSEHGLAGARVDRIAAAAGRQQGAHLPVLRQEGRPVRGRARPPPAQLDGRGADARRRARGRRRLRRPAVRPPPRRRRTCRRLVFWEGLERGPATAADTARAAYHDEKVERFRELLAGRRPRHGRGAPAHDRVARERLARARAPRRVPRRGESAADRDRAARRRAALVASATALAREAEAEGCRGSPARRRRDAPAASAAPRRRSSVIALMPGPDPSLVAWEFDRRAVDRRGNCHRGRRSDSRSAPRPRTRCRPASPVSPEGPGQDPGLRPADERSSTWTTG